MTLHSLNFLFWPAWLLWSISVCAIVVSWSVPFVLMRDERIAYRVIAGNLSVVLACMLAQCYMFATWKL